MIPIVVYAGGNIIIESTGIDYDNPPKFSFFRNEDTYFDEVKTMIYGQLGLLKNQYFLSIRDRYNTWGTSAYHFCLIPIRDEVEWQMIFQMATIKINWRMIELYVKISSIDNARDSLNNLSEISNKTENIIPSIINLAHKIHKFDPKRLIYPTPIGPNLTDEWEQNDCDEGDDVRNENNDVLEKEKRNDDDFVPDAHARWRARRAVCQLLKFILSLRYLVRPQAYDLRWYSKGSIRKKGGNYWAYTAQVSRYTNK
jgi:hypothetical protein